MIKSDIKIHWIYFVYLYDTKRSVSLYHNWMNILIANKTGCTIICLLKPKALQWANGVTILIQGNAFIYKEKKKKDF